MTSVKGEQLMQALRMIEQRCMDNAAGLPQQEKRPDIWAGVLFGVGETSLISPLEDIAEVVEPPPDITRVPAAKSWVCGIANNRGTLLPIFDLKAFLFGASTARDPKNRVLVVHQKEFPFGLLVGEVVGIRHFQASAYGAEVPEVPSGIDGLLAGCFSRGQDRFPVFSLRRLGQDARFNLAAN